MSCFFFFPPPQVNDSLYSHPPSNTWANNSLGIKKKMTPLPQGGPLLSSATFLFSTRWHLYFHEKMAAAANPLLEHEISLLVKDLLDQIKKAPSRSEARMRLMNSIHNWFQENTFKPDDVSSSTYEILKSFLAAPNVRFNAEINIKEIWKKTRGMFD